MRLLWRDFEDQVRGVQDGLIGLVQKKSMVEGRRGIVAFFGRMSRGLGWWWDWKDGMGGWWGGDGRKGGLWGVEVDLVRKVVRECHDSGWKMFGSDVALWWGVDVSDGEGRGWFLRKWKIGKIKMVGKSALVFSSTRFSPPPPFFPLPAKPKRLINRWYLTHVNDWQRYVVGCIHYGVKVMIVIMILIWWSWWWSSDAMLLRKRCPLLIWSRGWCRYVTSFRLILTWCVGWLMWDEFRWNGQTKITNAIA